MTQSEYALIVAGGKGTRMESDLPKQFLEVDGKPILLHTLEAFYRYSEKITVILVLPQDDFPIWNKIVEKHKFEKPLIVQSGGVTRFHSVRRGLERISGPGLVAIHDGVRPLISEAIIHTSFRVAEVHGSAVAAVKLKESLRMQEVSSSQVNSNQIFKAVDRSKFRMIQTPQTFDIAMIKKAYSMEENPSFTDDASVAESAGYAIALFEGSYDNIKVTTPEDLVLAEALLTRPKRL